MAELNPVLKAREERRQERLKNIRTSSATPKVRVVPKNDVLRKALFHPGTGMRFPAQGSAEWPLDQFTKRRIRDGDVTIEEDRSRGRPEEHHERRPEEHHERHRRAPAEPRAE